MHSALVLLVCIEAQRHALQHPVRGVLRGGEVRLEDQPDAHGVAVRLGHVNGRAERTVQLELGSLDGDDLCGSTERKA